jgi:hypothetical protein
VRAAAIVIAVTLVSCSGDQGEPEASAQAPDVEVCLDALAALGDIQPPDDLPRLAAAADEVADVAEAGRARVSDDNLAGALTELAGAARALADAARGGTAAGVQSAARATADAYAALDAAAQGMETGECRKESWGSAITNIPG